MGLWRPLSSTEKAIEIASKYWIPVRKTFTLPHCHLPTTIVFFLKLAKFFVPLSVLATIAGVVLMVYPGPKLSIDFTGGTLIEITAPTGATAATISDAVRALETTPRIDYVSTAITGDGTAIIRIRDISNDEHTQLIAHLKKTFGEIDEQQFTTIGPTVGATLKHRAVMATALACIGIALYVAFAFRKVPRKLSPWRFGLITVLTLMHDVIFTVSVFIILSHLTSFEIDTLFITALLTTLGYSVNDTIVIFDRIRENVSSQGRHEEFAQVTERSLRETIGRSFNTGFSTLIMLFALYFFGSSSIRWFVLALIVGISVGTYSSIFLAAPLLVYWKKKS